MESSSFSPGALNAGALSVFSQALQAHAHNVANVSTDKFKQITPVLADGPSGNGVRLAAITRAGTPLRPGGASAASAAGEGATSGTELAVELPSMLGIQRAFQANAQAVKTADEMLGYLFDTKA